MSNAEWWVMCFAFIIVMAFLHSLGDRLKRIEKKLDKMSDK